MATTVEPQIELVLGQAAHQSPPRWRPFEKAGMGAPFPGRFHRKGQPLPGYLSVADDSAVSGLAALAEFSSQHAAGDPKAPSPASIRRRLSHFGLDGATVLVADASPTLEHLGASPSDIRWRERSAWAYCQDAADLARRLSLDGIICCSATRPHDCRTIALFPPISPQVLSWQSSREGTIAALQDELGWAPPMPLIIRSGVQLATDWESSD